MKIIRANQVQNLWGTVHAVADSNVDITDAPATIDTVALGTGDRVLLTGQTNKVENGVYIYTVGVPNTLARPTHDKNLLSGAQNTLGASVVASGGSAFAQSFWFLSGTNGSEGGYENMVAIIDTDEMEFRRVGVNVKELDFGTSDLSGDINGTNDDFTLATAYQTGTVFLVVLNGVALNFGVDWTRSGAVITLLPAPQPGDSITALVLY